MLLMALFVAQPSYAQKLYPYEPLMMDPYTTIYVNDGSCSAGKVLKVQGAPRNQRRKKSCVPMSDLQGVRAYRSFQVVAGLLPAARPRMTIRGPGRTYLMDRDAGCRHIPNRSRMPGSYERYRCAQ